MIFAFWNVRGVTSPLKQGEVYNFTRKNNIDVIGLLETKLSGRNLQYLIRNVFGGWKYTSNFDLHAGGRILVLWNPLTVSLVTIGHFDQGINCEVSSLVDGSHVLLSFVYGHNRVVERRSMWNELEQFSLGRSLPWLILGDFNTVFSEDEKANGREVTSYELRDPTDFCMRCFMIELPFSGCKFTWSNGTVKSRIDHALVNNAWLDQFGASFAHYPASGCISDHSPGLIFTECADSRPNVCFKFLNMWTKHPSFFDLVSDSWREEVQGTKMFVLCKKLKHLKTGLKRLNAKDFSHISERVLRAKSALEDLQVKFQSEHNNLHLQEDLKAQQATTRRLINWEKSFFSQMTKGLSIRFGDRCTKFFHSWVKRSKVKGKILSIERQDGTFATSRADIAGEFLGFYKCLLGTREYCVPVEEAFLANGRLLDHNSAESLAQPVLPEEIWNAFLSIGRDKSPGPDGYSSHFFIKSWDIIGKDVTDAVTEFFENGRLLKQLNHSIIALIPKVDHARKVGEFRPISLCNVVYKAISKILASRLSGVLPLLVDEAQAGFVQGRVMAENILLLQELIRHYGRKRTVPMCLIKIDILKAFDSISWSYLEDLLVGFKFPHKFINWIMECVTTTSYSISINGSLEGYFKGERGLRQGDPISPFLFVLAMEYLSRMLKSLHSHPNFKFHVRCDKHKITHLAFADDLLLFSKGDRDSIKALMDVLEVFGNTSGLRCNLSKSELYTAGLNDSDVFDLHTLTGLRIGSFPFRYLGVPIAGKSLQLVHFGGYIRKIQSLTALWNVKTLSYMGRVELIRSVIQGVHAFWMGILPIPAGVHKCLVKIARNFLWGAREDKKKAAWVSWKDVCKPKAEGGLGLFDLYTWNKSLLFKHLWNLQCKKDSLWVRWIHHTIISGTISLGCKLNLLSLFS